jgi:hypothetical protein
MFRCGNIVLLTTFFDMPTFTILTPLSLLSWCRYSFPIVDLKIALSPNSALKCPNRILYCTHKNDRQTSPIPHTMSFESLLYPHLVHAHSKQWHNTSGLSQLHDILSLTNSTLLDEYRFLFQRKNIIPSMSPLSHLASCTSNKSNLYLANSMATVVT